MRRTHRRQAGSREAHRRSGAIRPTPPIPGRRGRLHVQHTARWASDANGVTTTGLDKVDLWVGGLAEVTNLFGGLLGSTFNYVFQTQLEKLQDGDRLYYLARTPGMNLRTQLEGNSFSELIQRNTDGTNSLKADAFATADCKFQLGQPRRDGSRVRPQRLPRRRRPDDAGLQREPAAASAMPDGTIQYRARNTVDPSGINGQAVYNGTPGVDRVMRRQRQRHLLGW